MNHVPRAEAARILAAIAPTPPAKTTVWVMKTHAHLFRRVQKDGRQYIVQDPTNVSVQPTHLERPMAGSQDGAHQTS